MKTRILHFWSWVSGLGITADLDEEQVRSTMTLNRLAFIAGLAILPFCLPELNPTNDQFGWIEFFCFGGFLGILFFNAQGRYETAVITLIVTTLSKIFFTGSYRGVNAGEQLFFLPLVIGILLLYDLKKDRIGWLMFGFSLGIFVLLEASHYELMSPTTPFAEGVIRQMFTVNFVISAAIVISIVYYYSQLVREQQIKIKQASDEERSLNQQLEQHLAELSSSNTQLKHQEQALKEALDKAEAASRAKSEFLALMNHELRTPLHAVISYSNLLQETSPNSEQKEYIEAVHQSGENLFVIVDHILNLSQFEAGRMQLYPEVVAASIPLSRAMEAIGKAASDKALSLEIHIHSAVETMVEIDPYRVQQILTNIFDNAIKFTNAGGITASTVVQSHATGADLIYEISDTGIGIDKEHQESIFLPFFQSDTSSTRTYGGTGLGLAICRQLLTEMGGSISVESVPGEGSTFQITIPTRVTETGGTEELKPLDREGPIADKSLILLVEDHPVNQKLAKTMLTKIGYKFKLATNGAEAMRILKQETFSLVLMDIQMPVMDGIEATKMIRKSMPTDQQPVIIAMTANTTDKDREHCLDAGMNDFLAKPVKKMQLEAMLTKWLRPAPPAIPPGSPSSELRLEN